MRQGGFEVAVPRRDPSVAEEPIVNLTSGYIERACEMLPPWKLHQDYTKDLLAFRLGSLDDGVLAFTRRKQARLSA